MPWTTPSSAAMRIDMRPARRPLTETSGRSDLRALALRVGAPTSPVRRAAACAAIAAAPAGVPAARLLSRMATAAAMKIVE